MTRHDFRWRAVAAACSVALVLGASSCTSNSADDPISSQSGTTASASVVDSSSGTQIATASTPAASPTASVIDVPTPSSAPPASLDAEAQESADRAAIEAQWVKFWEIYNGIVRTPAEQRSKVLDTVTIEPIRSQILNAAANFDAQGIDYYGAVKQHPYWVTPINGKPFAVMRDCQDQSKYGSVYVSTGAKRSVGPERDNLQAGFVLGEDKVWRVQELQYLDNVPC